MLHHFYVVLFSLIFLLIFNNSFAQVIIKGNQRVEKQNIEAVISDINLSQDNISSFNIALKKLYETGLFLEVNIYEEDKDIIIEVVENPIISNIKFRKNKKIDDEILESEISLKKRSIYSKEKLKSDIKRINDIYIKSGRFLSKIEPKIIQKKDNRIEIIFDIYEGKKSKIAKINFIGNKKYSDRNLLDEITTKQSKWYKFFGSNDNYDSDRVEFDKEKLRKFYNARGFADFEVISTSAQISPTKDKIFISFLIEEGIKYNFGKTKVINNIKHFDTNLLEKQINIKAGQLYNADKIEKIIDKMLKIMLDNGYAFGYIEPVIKRNKIDKIIDIDFISHQTEKIYINAINISGNFRTKDEVLRRELRVKEGDSYNLTKINRSRQRLMNLGFFKNVELEPERIGNSDKINLNISVKEKKTGELNFGIGYSTIDQINGNIGIKENNLFGTGRELGVNMRISKYNLSNELNYSKPWLFNREVTGGIDVFDYEIDSYNTLSYDQKTMGISLKATYPILEYISHQINYSLRDNKVSNISKNSSIIMSELTGKSVISLIGHYISFDNRDNHFNPTEGYYFTFSQNYAGIGGDVKYFKNEFEAGYYLPLISEKLIMKFVGKFGNINGVGMDVRTNDNFFLGGYNFRGFEYAGIGPRTKINGEAIGGDAVGGKTYYVTTTELKFPTGLPKEIGINSSLFFDAGTLTGVDSSLKNKADISDNASIRASYGLSISWSSPLGPIRLDFSKIHKSEKYDRKETFRFSFGNNF